MNRTIPKVRKIAVLRANAIGDFIFSFPALEALRLAYPDAEIVLLGKRWHFDFWKSRPGPIDRVEIVPAYRGVGEGLDGSEDVDEIEAFFARMQAEEFDIAVQIYGGGRYSNPFVRRLGARLSVGLKSTDAIPLDLSVPYILYQPEVMRYLEVTALIGADRGPIEPNLTIIDSDLYEACQVMPETGAPFAVFHPGAGDPRRRWPVEKFAEVGDALASKGLNILVSGTEQERDLVEGVISAMRHPATDICGSLTLSGLAGLFSQAKVVISNDSGPLHLARATGAATVGIYWCGNLILAGSFTRTRHRPAISWRLDCPVCGIIYTRQNCLHRESIVSEVSTQEVIESALDLINQNEQSGSLEASQGKHREGETCLL